MPLTVAEFVQRWKIYSQSEKAGAHEHFLNLCEVLGQKTPAEIDSAGENYAFEKHVSKTRGGKGFADVWLRDRFAWEYKGKHKNLNKAYEQLNDYREDLGNPPLLVVCDLERFEVHTNFTATSKRVYAFDLDDLNRNHVTAACPLPPLDVLRALFGDYNVLRPERTDAQVTQEVAKKFARLAERLELGGRNLGAGREEIAHFLMRLLFCLFADSIGLLPDHLFRRLIQQDRFSPKKFLRKLTNLFEAMSEPDGIFGEHSVKYFNGGLFDSSSIIQLDQADLGILYDVSKNYDWSRVAPAIFGTLFERSLDPVRRSLIGAHYTSQEDILLLVEPVVMRPLERRWEAVKARIAESLAREKAEEEARESRQARLRVGRESEKLLGDWIAELTGVKVLDPACGSGNFLYVALRRLLDLWLETTRFAVAHSISLVTPAMVSPRQLLGIETEFYAHELASVVVWIGYLQWKYEHSVHEDREPILEKLANIEHGDAILRYDGEGKPYEPEWPQADFMIGNPPFLGGKLLRRELGDKYVDDVFAVYEGRVKAESDLVVYWFEKARQILVEHPMVRVGLVATQAIRGGASRGVLKRISETASIFFAWSDRDWINEGAAVHISLIGFDGGDESERTLDGIRVNEINPDLTSGTDATLALPLIENANICFMGTTKAGSFDIDFATANKMLRAPINPNGRHNSDVVRPWINALDITRRPRGMYIIDFGVDMSEEAAALYEMPFEYVRAHVYPERKSENRDLGDKPRWLHGRSRPELRNSLSKIPRYIITPRVSKHRLFAWLGTDTLPDSATFAFARSDDYFFGVLHSSIHEIWARTQGTQLREVESGFRYTPNSTFDTFPFPWPPGTEPTEEAEPRVRAIAEAARELVRLRDNWLNPPNCPPEELKKRTLTNLYNERPAWLENAHRALDQPVFAAYGWPWPLGR
ncbi:class I SAM-dependent DNA methyltransferase, partial [Terracidiphilus sp.]|uniref:class I SAM-dependent DNA methyltransferase n=1 Tax=Terracidiphilus sp. TaxID=1964191 RepID=UPI003C1CF3AF